MRPAIDTLKRKAKEMGFKSVKKMLQQLYDENNGVNSVGDLLNVSGMSIHKYLKLFGIKIKSKGGNQKEFKINWELIAKKKGYESVQALLIDVYKVHCFSDLAVMFRCSVSTVHRIYKKYNVDVSLNKKKKRTTKQIRDLLEEIKNAGGSKDKIVFCSCCKTKPVGEGLRFLCERCYRKF